MLKLIFTILLTGLHLYIHAQGPLDGYMKGKGILDIAPSLSFNRSSVFEGNDNQKFDTPYRGTMLSMYAAYGLDKRFDLVGTASAVFTENASGLQDGGLYVKYRPIYAQLSNKGRLGVIMGTGASFPIADYEPIAEGALGQKAISVPARLIIQWDTPLGLFFNFTGGYNFRLDEVRESDLAKIRLQRPDYEPVKPPNFSTFMVKVGFPAAHYYADAWVEWQNTHGGNNYAFGVPDLPQAYGVSYTQAGGTFYYSDGGRTGFFVGGAYIFNGRNVSYIRRISLGMVVKLLK